MLKWFIPLLILIGCSTKEVRQKSQVQTHSVFPFSEFGKILNPQSALHPIGRDQSLILMAGPEDGHAKIYKLNHQNRKFTLHSDVGPSVTGFLRDPSQKYYFISKDGNGDENHQFYLFSPFARSLKKFFGHPKRQATLVGFSNQSKYAYFRSNHKNKKVFSIYRVSLETGQSKQITPNNKSFDGFVVSQNGEQGALVQALGNNESHLYLLNITNGKLRKTLSRSGTNFQPTFFHPSKQELFLNTDVFEDRVVCAKISLENPKRVIQVRRSENKDTTCRYNPTTKLSLVRESYKGRTDLRIFEGIFEREIRTPLPHKSQVTQFYVPPNSRQAFVRIASANEPGNFYQFDLNQDADAKLKKISELNLSNIPNTAFARSFDLNYKSFDGLEIHGIFFAKDSWVSETKKRPVILWPHGGPDSHVTHSFHSWFQYLALNGYVVFAPNFRGSTGYGKKFETLNDRDWGGAHIKDLIWGKKALSQFPFIDPDQFYIVGASFGGFSTLSTITQYPKAFKGAVAIVALANLFTFFYSIPPDPAWRNEFLREMGDPNGEVSLYRERSPYFHVKQIQTPLKIYQAENDVRTVKAEMDRFVTRMRSARIPVSYEVLKNEGHSLSRPESKQRVLEGTVKFIQSMNPVAE